jgi:hypothetical protein
MSMSIRAVYDELAAHFAGASGSLTLRGTTEGGVWPSPRRPASESIPLGAVFVWVVSSEEPVQWIAGGSFSRQMHEGRFRVAARGVVAGQIAKPYGWIKSIMEFAHGNPPSGYSRLRFVEGIPRVAPLDDPQEIPIVYGDGRYRYFED